MATHYTVYGLVISSEYPLPELPEADPSENVDVVICLDAPPPLPEGSRIAQFVLGTPQIGRFSVRDGREIYVQPIADADPTLVRLFLLGSAMAAILHQRNLLPLHASSVDTERGAVLFAGDSGAGKSTLAAAFTRRGYRLIADDVSVIDVKDGIPIVRPGYPQMKLWTQSLQLLDVVDPTLRRVTPNEEKYAVPVHHSFKAETRPVYALFTLVRSTDAPFAILPITGMGKLDELRRQVYRREFFPYLAKRDLPTTIVPAFLQQVAMGRILRPATGIDPDLMITAVEKALSLPPHAP